MKAEMKEEKKEKKMMKMKKKMPAKKKKGMSHVSAKRINDYAKKK